MKRFITPFSMLILMCLSGFLFAQPEPHSCGTEPDAKTIKWLTKTRAERQSFDLQRSANQNVTWIPIQIHFVTETNGNGSMDDFTTDRIMGELNEEFRPANIQFFECSSRNTISNSTLYNFDYTTSDATLSNTYDVANVLNLYFVGSITLNGSNLCGYAFFPSGPDHILVQNFCAGTGTTVIHEFGHAFTLYHTHGKSNSVLTDELVDGSNCTTAGDDVCDTPAEPILLGQVNSDCAYTGNQLDNNGQPFDPQTNNNMSYAPSACRDIFTPQQYARMAYSAQNDRPYLNCSSVHPCMNAIDNFPYTESFENGFGGWTQNPDEQFDFSLASGPTPTALTGPTAAKDGSTYFYAEGSAPNQANYVAVLNSPCFDFSNLAMGELRFWYHMYGSTTGRLIMQASTDNGYTWGMPNFIFDQIGDQGNQWNEAIIDMSPWANEPFVRFRFGVVLGGEFSDIAVDQITLLATTPCTGFSIAASASNISCFGQGDGTATVTVTGGATPFSYAWSNGGTTASISNLAEGNYRVDVTDNNGCLVSQQVTVVEPFEMTVELAATNTTASGNADGAITFANIGGAQLPISYAWSTGATSYQIAGLDNGNYTLTVTDANGCKASNRIFLSDPLACTGTKSNWPHTNNLEGGTGLFKQNTDDDRNWRKRSGATPTNNTGPSAAQSGNFYRYVESSGNANNPGKTSVLTTKKCLDFSVLNQPTFTFWYHMYGNTMGTLDVQISYDAGATWRGSIWSRAGDQGNSWQKAVIDLSVYPSTQKRIRIVGTTGSGSRSDIAIDLYRFVSAINADDISTNEISMQVIVQDIKSFDILNVYPNPASSVVNIELETPLNEKVLITLYNQMGQEMVRQEVQSYRGENHLAVNVEQLLPGMYFMKIAMGEIMQTRQVVIQK